MGENFSRIKFTEHGIHKDGLHGIYEIDEKTYVSVCTGGGAYSTLNKVDYWVLLANRHGEWSNSIKSTFEVAVVDRLNEDIVLFEGEPVYSELNVESVEEIIEKIKHSKNFK